MELCDHALFGIICTIALPSPLPPSDEPAGGDIYTYTCLRCLKTWSGEEVGRDPEAFFFNR